MRGREIAAVRLSGLRLRSAVSPALTRRLRGRTIRDTRRHGKYLLIDLDDGSTLLSHLGMSGRWLFFTERSPENLPHVHVRFAFTDGSELWFQDPRRFGLLKRVPTDQAFEDPALASLGADPVLSPPAGAELRELARGSRVNVKTFLMDQRRLAGIGNIYASEILHWARVDPRRLAGRVTAEEWAAVAQGIPAILGEAIERMGTTFSAYRTLWNEPGSYGERLLVYDRAESPCRRCGTAIRRIVQGQRSTFFCPRCQGARRSVGVSSRIAKSSRVTPERVVTSRVGKPTRALRRKSGAKRRSAR